MSFAKGGQRLASSPKKSKIREKGWEEAKRNVEGGNPEGVTKAERSVRKEAVGHFLNV